MNVAEMIKNVRAECHPITNIDGIIRRWLNRGQQVVASASKWSWLRQYGQTLATTAAQENYALSPLVDTAKIITFYDSGSPQHIRYMSEQEFRSKMPGPTATGVPYLYRIKGYSPVRNQPSSASVLTFVSSSAADTTQVLNIQGLNGSGVLFSETVTLNGTSSVSSTNSYAKVMSLSKSAPTIGSVTCTSNSGAVTNVVIAPSERYLSHPIVGFYSIPDGARTLFYDFTMKLPNISADGDVSLIPEQYHDAIELYAMHRCFKHLNNPSMAQLTIGELKDRLKMMADDDRKPSGVVTMDSFDANCGLQEARLPGYFPAGA